MAQLCRANAGLLGSVALLLGGCAAAPKAVAPGFYGVWVSADSGIHSWLQIEPHRVVNFGFTQSSGRCATTAIDIVAKDRVIVPVSSLGSGQMSLRLEGGVLVITGNYATQRYVPASRESICRESGGTYLPGAPNH
jgi:hypothetical protein